MDVIPIGSTGAPTTLALVETDRARALDHLKKILRDTPGHIYKVGIATNPTGRSYGHNRVAVDERVEGDMVYVTFQTGLWDRMFVIFRSPSEQIIRRAEIEFIDAAKTSFGDFGKSGVVTMNENPGGGGAS